MKLIENRDEVILEPHAPARAAVIWLHGLGADGYDFAPIVPELGLEPGAGVRFVFPHAPVRPITINNGLPMRAWYDIVGLDLGAAQDAAGIRASEQRVLGYLQQQRDAGIPASRLVLAGFSQGGAIALHTGLRLREAIGGLVVLSAYLPLQHDAQREATSAAGAMPVFLAHGRHDAIVPYSWGEQAADWLRARQQPLSWHRYAMGHEVCDEEIGDLGRWLIERLG